MKYRPRSDWWVAPCLIVFLIGVGMLIRWVMS